MGSNYQNDLFRLKETRETIIGYTCGVFDLFHIGHLNIIRNAKSLCDRLIVGVSTDQLRFATKGDYPIIPFDERIEIVRNIKDVDIAIPQETPDKVVAWKKLKYHVLFVGDDWYNTFEWQRYEIALRKLGVDVVYFPYTKTTSSTMINVILDERRKKRL